MEERKREKSCTFHKNIMLRAFCNKVRFVSHHRHRVHATIDAQQKTVEQKKNNLGACMLFDSKIVRTFTLWIIYVFFLLTFCGSLGPRLLPLVRQLMLKCFTFYNHIQFSDTNFVPCSHTHTKPQCNRFSSNSHYTSHLKNNIKNFISVNKFSKSGPPTWEIFQFQSKITAIAAESHLRLSLFSNEVIH